MNWASKVIEYEPQLRQIAKDGVTLRFEPFDYGCAVGLAASSGAKRCASRVLSACGVPSRIWFKRILENRGWLRRKVRSIPPEEAAARLAQWLRHSEFGRPVSETGQFGWEFMEGNERALHQESN